MDFDSDRNITIPIGMDSQSAINAELIKGTNDNQSEVEHHESYCKLPPLGLGVPPLNENSGLQLDQNHPPHEDILRLLRKSTAPNEKETDSSKYTHGISFYRTAFRHDENSQSKKPSFPSKRRSDEKCQSHIVIMSQWKNYDRPAMTRFRNKYPQGYKMMLRYRLKMLEMPDGTLEFLLLNKAVPTKHSGAAILPQSRVFDAIH
jgi:hypothetical protein